MLCQDFTDAINSYVPNSPRSSEASKIQVLTFKAHSKTFKCIKCVMHLPTFTQRSSTYQKHLPVYLAI